MTTDERKEESGRWRKLRRWPLLLTLSSVVTACSLPFSNPPHPRQYVHLVMAPSGPVARAADVFPKVLLVAEIENYGRGGGQQILFKRDSQTISSYRYTFWTRPLQDQLQEYLIRRIEQAELFTGVTGTGTGIVGDYQLNIQIYDYYLDYESAPPQLVARVKAELLDLQTRRFVQSKEFEQILPIDSDLDLETVVEAFSNVSERLISTDIIPWVVSSLKVSNEQTVNEQAVNEQTVK